MMFCKMFYIGILLLLLNYDYVKSGTKYGIKGFNVELKCSYNSTKKAIFWLKGKNGLAVNTSIFDHVQPDEFRQRLSITGNHTNGEYYLTIATVKETDEGEYACSVSGVTGTDVMQLSVIEGPINTNIAYKTEDNHLVGTENQDLTISCTAVSEDLAPDMVLQIMNKNHTINGSRTIQLTLPTLNRIYHGTAVTCLAGYQRFSYFPDKDTATIYVRLNLSTPTFIPNLVVTEETKPLSVTCKSTGGRPAPTERKWTIGNADVTSDSTLISSTHDQANDTYTVMSTLTYSVEWKDDKKILSCGFQNDATGSFITSTRVIDVKFSPSVSVENKTFITSDSSRQIVCVANGNPASYMYSKWQHKSKYGTVIRMLDGNKTLTLPTVSDETRYQDTGEYVCTVSNGIKDKDGNVNQQASGFVFSQASPVFLSGDHQTMLGQLKRDVEIEVIVYSEPKYTSLMWLKGSSTISSPTKYTMSDVRVVTRDTFHDTEVQVDGHKLALTIHNLEEEDFVNYTLRLANGVGQTVEHLVLLMPASPPEIPTNFTQVDATESTVTLTWLPGFDGGHEQTFIVEYRTPGSSGWNKATVPKNLQTTKDDLLSYELSGLKDGTLYEIRMYAHNKFNNSDATDIVKIFTKADCVITLENKANTLTGATAGLSVVTVISVLINAMLVYRLLTERRQHTKTTRSSISRDLMTSPEFYDNITDTQEKNLDIDGRNYDTLGTKDKPNAYEVLGMSTKGHNTDSDGRNYETLGTKDKPNVYEAIGQSKKDRQSKLYSNTAI